MTTRGPDREAEDAPSEPTDLTPPTEAPLPQRPRKRRPPQSRGLTTNHSAKWRHRSLARHWATYHDLQAAAAYCGYAVPTVRKLLQRPDVARMVRWAESQVVAKEAMAADEWRERVAAICRADVRHLTDEDGKLLPVGQLESGAASLVAGVDVTRKGEGEEETVKVRMVDKVRALELMGRSIGTLKEGSVNISQTTVVLSPEVVARLEDEDVAALGKLLERVEAARRLASGGGS